ncbi:MAG: hypothetical protein ABIU96_00860 [Rhodanobacter sp.]
MSSVRLIAGQKPEPAHCAVQCITPTKRVAPPATAVAAVGECPDADLPGR